MDHMHLTTEQSNSINSPIANKINGITDMQSFKAHILEEDVVAAAKKKLKGMKGKQVSFTHQTSGEKVSGTYHGLKQMGGRSYAHVEVPGKGAFRVPPHHIH